VLPGNDWPLRSDESDPAGSGGDEESPEDVQADLGDGGAYRLADSDPPALARPAEDTRGTSAATESVFLANEQAGPRDQVEPEFPDQVPDVEQVWSRWDEWKEPLAWTVAAAGFAILIIVAGVWVPMAILVASLGYATYQVVISLEIPVRITPEQAVREFYAAVGHRLPNLRRMYLLLTSDGKKSEHFDDFADFRAYWKAQLSRLSRAPVWLFPLDFRVAGVRCRYNPEKELAVIRYRLQVFPRGCGESVDPIAEFDASNLAVKGRDGQWYLHHGVLPGVESGESGVGSRE
jgi:hypothetical protein